MTSAADTTSDMSDLDLASDESSAEVEQGASIPDADPVAADDEQAHIDAIFKNHRNTVRDNFDTGWHLNAQRMMNAAKAFAGNTTQCRFCRFTKTPSICSAPVTLPRKQGTKRSKWRKRASRSRRNTRRRSSRSIRTIKVAVVAVAALNKLPKDIVGRIGALRDGINKLHAWCLNESTERVLSKEDKRQLARDATLQLGELLVSVYSNDLDNLAQLVERLESACQ
jgi:hypothetical protein